MLTFNLQSDMVFKKKKKKLDEYIKYILNRVLNEVIGSWRLSKKMNLKSTHVISYNNLRKKTTGLFLSY